MNYNDLTVWKKSMDFVTKVYKITKQFPSDERYGLTDQMRRAAISIPSNIAEGHARKSKVDFARFLRISLGSCTELETQVMIAHNLEYLTKNEMDPMLEESLEIRKMITKLIATLS